MKRILDNCSKRFGHHGWALVVKEFPNHPCSWSFCTTRKEVRELQASLTPDMINLYVPVKVKVKLVAV